MPSEGEKKKQNKKQQVFYLKFTRGVNGGGGVLEHTTQKCAEIVPRM